MTFTSVSSKATKLEDQVKEILSKNGYSSIFNEVDFKYFKKQTAKEFNEAVRIAELFISYFEINSDFDEYIF